MPTRDTLDRVLEELRGVDWDVFPAVDDPAFSPRISGKRDHALWWSNVDDRAFDAAGKLARPLHVWWRGNRSRLQLACAHHRVGIRIASVDLGYAPERAVATISMLDERPVTDLDRLLVAFAALRGRGVTALELAGNTKSDGWSTVATGTNRETAVFWHSQAHDAFDGIGQLAEDLHLYWSGDVEKIIAALRDAGLRVEVPDSADVAIVVRGADTVAPALEPLGEPSPPSGSPSPNDASIRRSSPSAPEGFHQPGAPVDRLVPLANGGVVCVSGFGSGVPETPLAIVDPADFRRVEVLAAPEGTFACVGVVALPDHRLLVAWTEPGRAIRLFERVATQPFAEIVSMAVSHAAPGCALATDAAGTRVATPTQRGISIREVGAAGTRVKVETTGVAVRRARPAGDVAWRELAHPVDARGEDTYPLIALSPDGTLAARVTLGGLWACAFEIASDSPTPRWREAVQDQVIRSRAVSSLAFTPWGQLAVVVRAVDGDRELHTLLLFASADGARSWRACETAVAAPTAVGWDADALIVGSLDGRITRVSLDGAILDARQAFANGHVTAIATMPGGAIIAGSDRGELAVIAPR